MRLAALALAWLFSGTALAAETPWPTDGWQTSTPEEEGLSSGALADLVDAVGLRKQDSLLVVRHGHLVLEVYYAPYRAGIPHDLRSVTKSVVGTLTAIAITDGALDSTQHKVLDLFADKSIANVDDNKKAMTVQTLLDMTSGIAWREQNYTRDETIMQMFEAPDRTAFVLDQPMADPPGSKFYYDGGNPYLLSAIISRKTGQNAWDYGREKLFRPLGILTERWRAPDRQGVTDGQAGLALDPRDMLKIGYLYLHNGEWNGKQLIAADWVQHAEAGPVPATFGLHYGNLWWSLPEKGAVMALGRHSQRIMVLPKYDIVVAMTGYMPDDEFYPAGRLVNQVVAAVRSDGALPPDPVAQSALAASLQQAATEKPIGIGQTSELASAISGRTYRFAGATTGPRSMTLHLVGEDPSWAAAYDAPDGVRYYSSGPIGLDGRFGKSALPQYGLSAVRGRWVASDQFEIERRILGHSETQRWLLTFHGDDLDLHYSDTDGTVAHFVGTAVSSRQP